MGKGTSTSAQTQVSQGTPWAPTENLLTTAMGNIAGLLPQAAINPAQSAALGEIEKNARAAAPLGQQSIGVAQGLLAGGGAEANDGRIAANLEQYRAALAPVAAGTSAGQNPALKVQLDAAADDVRNQVNAQFAAAGRDGSPANSQALARGITMAQAPVIAAQYNTDVQRAMDASAALYGAGNTTAGLLNQSRGAANANAIAGMDATTNALGVLNAAPNAALGAEAQRFAIPAGNYQTLLGSVQPFAQAFGTTTSNTSASQTLSPMQQYALLAQGLGHLIPKGPISFGA